MTIALLGLAQNGWNYITGTAKQPSGETCGSICRNPVHRADASRLPAFNTTVSPVEILILYLFLLEIAGSSGA